MDLVAGMTGHGVSGNQSLFRIKWLYDSLGKMLLAVSRTTSSMQSMATGNRATAA
jgi:hypothetical protein